MGRHSGPEDRWDAARDLAWVEAGMSTCVRDKVGAVILSAGGEIVGRGHNDTPGGDTCAAGGCSRASKFGLKSGAPQAPDERCYHAEAAAIAEAGLAADGGHILVTRQPCPWCAILIEGAGIVQTWIVAPRD